jgi:hypothetical protein
VPSLPWSPATKKKREKTRVDNKQTKEKTMKVKQARMDMKKTTKKKMQKKTK